MRFPCCRHLSRLAVPAILAAAALPPGLSAQEVPPVQPGDQVRVQAPAVSLERPAELYVLRSSPDSLVVTGVLGHTRPLAIPGRAIESLELQTGRTRF